MSAPDHAAWRKWEAPTDGQSLRKWQAGRCAWCDDEPTYRLVEDHCHRTGLVRGLLCRRCNTAEGQSRSSAWNAWRSGDNAANAARHFEVYVGRQGQTPIWPWSALAYYTWDEQNAWHEQIVIELYAGADWPIEAPWTEAALARRDDHAAHTRAAIEALPSLLTGGAA